MATLRKRRRDDWTRAAADGLLVEAVLGVRRSFQRAALSLPPCASATPRPSPFRLEPPSLLYDQGTA